MPNDTAPVQDEENAGERTAKRAGASPTRRFSCVYLTSSIRVAEIASSMVDSVQIHIHRATTLDRAEALLRNTKSRVPLTDISFERGGWEDALRMAASLPLWTAVVLARSSTSNRRATGFEIL